VSGSVRGEVEVDEEELGAAAALGEAPIEAELLRAPADLSSQFEQLRRWVVKLTGGGGSVRRGEWIVCRREEPIASIYRVERWPRGAVRERPWHGAWGLEGASEGRHRVGVVLAML
jgi:hypothetical protein